MGLAVASASLQAVVERASRDKRLLDFERLDVETEGSAVLGAGATAAVFRGAYRGRPVAVKAYAPAELTEEEVAKSLRGARHAPGRSPKRRTPRRFGREMALMASLAHRNVLYLHGLCVRPPQVLLVLEFCGRGDLATSFTRAGRGPRRAP